MKSDKKIPDFDKGIFSELILDFISYKRNCGLKYEDSAEYVLRTINKKLNNYNLQTPVITKEMIDDLVKKRPHEQYSTQSRRITLLRQLALYLNLRGINAYVYPEYNIRKEEKTFIPYIFTDAEINSIFLVADNLPTISKYSFYHMVYPVLIRLLYSCGLRLSEAICLKNKNIDSKAGTLYIDKSKNSKSRIVAMSASMNKFLYKYIISRYGDEIRPEKYVFEAPDGGRYNRGSVRVAIMKIFKDAGLPHLIKGKHPRVHDLSYPNLNKIQTFSKDA